MIHTLKVRPRFVARQLNLQLSPYKKYTFTTLATQLSLHHVSELDESFDGNDYQILAEKKNQTPALALVDRAVAFSCFSRNYTSSSDGRGKVSEWGHLEIGHLEISHPIKITRMTEQSMACTYAHTSRLNSSGPICKFSV